MLTYAWRHTCTALRRCAGVLRCCNKDCVVLCTCCQQQQTWDMSEPTSPFFPKTATGEPDFRCELGATATCGSRAVVWHVSRVCSCSLQPCHNGVGARITIWHACICVGGGMRTSFQSSTPVGSLPTQTGSACMDGCPRRAPAAGSAPQSSRCFSLPKTSMPHIFPPLAHTTHLA